MLLASEPEPSGHQTRSQSLGNSRNAFLEPEPEPFKIIPAPHPCFWPCSVILAA